MTKTTSALAITLAFAIPGMAHAASGLTVLAPNSAKVEHGNGTTIPLWIEFDSSQCITDPVEGGSSNCPTAFETKVTVSTSRAQACLGFDQNGTCLTLVPDLASNVAVFADGTLAVGTSFSVTVSARGTNGAASSGSKSISMRVAPPLLTVPPEAWAQDPAVTIGVNRDGEAGTLTLSLEGAAGISASFPSTSSTTRAMNVNLASTVAAGTYAADVVGVLGLRDPHYPILIHVPFQVALAATQLTVPRGLSGSTTLTVSRHPDFTGDVAFLIARATPYAFGQPIVDASIDERGAVSIFVTACSPSGTVDFLVKGTSGSLTRSRTLRVVIP